MFLHAPPGYVCPFCVVVAGGEIGAPYYSRQSDVVFRAAQATAFINACWWPNNPGHVLVVPNVHIENLYGLVPEIAVQVHEAARQHNEPAGSQEVWHYHVHVFPRYAADGLYELHGQKRVVTPEERAPYAERLRAYFAAQAR